MTRVFLGQRDPGKGIALRGRSCKESQRTTSSGFSAFREGDDTIFELSHFSIHLVGRVFTCQFGIVRGLKMEKGRVGAFVDIFSMVGG